MAPTPVPVLIVDDDPAKRLALRAVLAPLGYLIVEADSGLAALRCVMAQDFAVILLDVCMPILDGPETAAIIRQRSQSKMTPIIFITAFGHDEIVTTDHYAQGAVDFIFAPVPPEELRAKVSVFAHVFMKTETMATRARKVQTSADQWRLLTDAAPIGIFQTDAENRYVYTNPRWSEITGIPSDGATGMAWDAIVGAEGRTTLVATLAAAVLEPEFWLRFEIRLPDFAPRIVQLTSKVVPDGKGGIAGWVGTLADVTAEAGAEAALSEARDQATEASRLKSDFLANMSHEIRTPMNGVIGMTDLLLETDLDARQRDYAQTVRDSGEALLMIINDILDFSRIEAGKLEVEAIPFRIGTIVDDVVNLLAGTARAKGIDLLTVVESSAPDMISGDPGRVRQVLTNLVGNALKFTQNGQVVVRVIDPRNTTRSIHGDGADEGGRTMIVRFEVSDTGDGIAPDKVDLIFQPFVQADSSTSRKYGGTGLGLAICRKLVALMGGECGVTSTLGGGSTFWFTIRVQTVTGQPADTTASAVTDLADVHDIGEPAPAADVPRTPVTTGPTPLAPGEPETGRLLLAEDNLINQKVAVEMLSRAGYRVDTVLNGAAAVRAVAARPYDAILMDCQMPEMNGYEATAAIRALRSSGRLTPIIAMTAGARPEDRDRCLAEGMDGYLSKPVRKDNLLALVARSVKDESAIAGPIPRVDHDPVGDSLDLTVFEELRLLDEATDEDFLAELVEQFVQDTEALLTDLRLAWSAGDSAAVTRTAHGIRGGSTQLGGRRLALSCRHLEEQAGTDHLSDDLAAIHAVETDYQDLRRSLVDQLTSVDRQREPTHHA
ncbi:MAG TPA: response regulator [Acidimicrobiales bacterium]|nr:response regulator [Acidimicrobiales bacterium]